MMYAKKLEKKPDLMGGGEHFYKGYIIFKVFKYGCSYYAIRGEYNRETNFKKYLRLKDAKAEIDRRESMSGAEVNA